MNIGLTRVTPPFAGIDNFDYGLRRALDAEFDWPGFGQSLLDQVLSYGTESVNNDTVRTVLGLAGMDALATLFDALARHDCAAAAMFTKELVSREVDIGFFLRELVDHFRSLFLLRQCGREPVAQLGVSNVELDFLSGFASRFSPSYLHAAWQMLINSHRSVTTSPEPASALDLLLVNLALLPQLLPASLVPEAPAGAPQTGRPVQSCGQCRRLCGLPWRASGKARTAASRHG